MMRPLTLTSVAVLALGTVSASTARASYVTIFEDVGSNVVEIGGGTLDLTDLRFASRGITGSFVQPSAPVYASGAVAAIENVFTGDISGPADWGPGSVTSASLSSGDGVGIEGRKMLIIVPQGYMFGAPLSETSTYLDTSLTSLGLTPGTYVYSWGMGPHADTFTVDVVASSVPEPSTWAMMLVSFAGLGYTALRRKGAIPVISA
jgi:PEP-CTERM motif-containing protein